jgi:hypothetical protein
MSREYPNFYREIFLRFPTGFRLSVADTGLKSGVQVSPSAPEFGLMVAVMSTEVNGGNYSKNLICSKFSPFPGERDAKKMLAPSPGK